MTEININMKKYIFDNNDDILFYEELSKLKEELPTIISCNSGNQTNQVQINQNNDSKEEIQMDVCLITNEILTKDYIKLPCNHSFNYVPLMKDLHSKNIKHSKNACYLLLCPYCRTVQTDSLPYHKKYGIAYMKGVHISKEEIAKQKAEEKMQKELLKAQKAEEKQKKELLKIQKTEEKLNKKTKTK